MRRYISEYPFLRLIKRICRRQEPPDYKTYIRSDEWRDRATAAKERAGWRCQTCNVPDNQAVLHAHHRTYERLGNEEPNDITVLCAECHAKFHGVI